MVGINIKTHFPHQVGMQQCGIEHDSHPTEWSNLNVQNLVNCPALTELNISEWSVETSRDAGKTENSEECFCCVRASSLKIVHFSVSVGIYASFIWTLPVGSLLRKAKAKKKKRIVMLRELSLVFLLTLLKQLDLLNYVWSRPPRYLRRKDSSEF